MKVTLSRLSEEGLDDVRLPTEWRLVPDPVIIGGCGSSDRPDWFVTLSHGDDRLMRVHLYPREHSPFTDAQLWRNFLAIGLGYDLHLISLIDRSVVSVHLGHYFCQVAATGDYLIAASGERLFRIQPDRTVLWASDRVGLDGVVLENVEPPVITGHGEWDPPGGWQPFLVSAASGATT